MTSVSGYRKLSRTFVIESESHRLNIIGQIRALPIAVKPGWRVVIEPDERTRSGEQNRLYWATLNEIAEKAWVGEGGEKRQYPPDAWHAYFAGKFIGHSEVPGGRLIPISTTTLTTSEFTEYVERIRAYASLELAVEFDQ
jgi:hypothetical protein